MTAPPPVIAVVGATATGKSDLAVELALRLGGEVVNADAMQLYRGMDVGTAKLTPGRAAGVSAPPARRAGRDRGGQPRRLPAARPRRHRRRWPRAGSRCWPAGPGCTCGPRSTSWDPATDPVLRRGWRPSWPATAARRCTPGWPTATRRPRPRSCRATAGGWCARWRSVELTGAAVLGHPAGGRIPPAGLQVAMAVPRAELDRRVAGRVERMWRLGSGRGDPPAARGAGWRRAGPPPGRSATRRCCGCSPGTAPRTRRIEERPSGPPGGSPGGRSPGSAGTRRVRLAGRPGRPRPPRCVLDLRCPRTVAAVA